MSKVLLARPSSLLVNNMKRLMESAGLEPTPLQELNGFSDFEASEVSGIIISTALTSSVKENYCEVMLMALNKFPNLPKYLASYSDFERAKKIAEANLDECGINMQVLSVKEALNQGVLNFAKQYVIITRADLEIETNFVETLKMIKLTMVQ